MASVKKKIIKNTIANTLLKFSQYIIGFLLFPFIVSYVGVEDYGVYLLVGAFIGYFGLLDFGVGSALVKYVAEFNAKDDKETINKMVNSTFIFYLCVGIVIFISIMIIGTFFVDIFNIDQSQGDKARLIAYLVAIGALTSWPMRSFATVLSGMQRHDINAVRVFIISIINAIATVLILISGYGITEIIFWGIVIGAIGQIALVIPVQRLLPYLDLRFKYMGFSTLKKIFTFSSVIFISQIMGILMLGLDRILVGFYVSVGAITSYAVARKLFDLVSTATLLPQSALLPAATELDTMNKKEELERLLIRGSKYTCAIALLTGTLIFVFAEPIIHFWMGDKFLDMVFPTRIFIFYTFFTSYGGISGKILFAQEKYKLILIPLVFVTVSNLILSLILVQYYGVTGVVLGTAIPWVVSSPFVASYVIKHLGFNLRKYFMAVVITTYIPAAIMGISMFFLLNFLPPTNIISLGIEGLIGVCIYFGLFFTFSLDNSEKNDVKKFLNKLKP